MMWTVMLDVCSTGLRDVVEQYIEQETEDLAETGQNEVEVVCVEDVIAVAGVCNGM